MEVRLKIKMDWLGFYKERYYKEIERRNQFNDRFNILLTIITISGGGYLLIIDKLFKVLESNNYRINIISFIIITMSIIIFILYIVIFYYMYNVYYENQYEQLRNSRDIEEKRNEIQKYYDENYNEYYKESGKTKEELIDEDMEEDLKEKYIKAFDYNSNKNNIRMKNNVRLNRFILVTAGLIIITYILALSMPYNETINVKDEKNVMERRYNYEQRKYTRIR